jgi:hypothetical protein
MHSFERRTVGGRPWVESGAGSRPKLHGSQCPLATTYANAASTTQANAALNGGVERFKRWNVSVSGWSQHRGIEVELEFIGCALHQVALDEVDAGQPQGCRGIRVFDAVADHLNAEPMRAIA